MHTTNAVHLSMRSARNTMGKGKPGSDTRDLWRRWCEGPSDHSVGEGPGRWECHLSMETGSHEGKGMSYA